MTGLSQLLKNGQDLGRQREREREKGIWPGRHSMAQGVSLKYHESLEPFPITGGRTVPGRWWTNTWKACYEINTHTHSYTPHLLATAHTHTAHSHILKYNLYFKKLFWWFRCSLRFGCHRLGGGNSSWLTRTGQSSQWAGGKWRERSSLQ